MCQSKYPKGRLKKHVDPVPRPVPSRRDLATFLAVYTELIDVEAQDMMSGRVKKVLKWLEDILRG